MAKTYKPRKYKPRAKKATLAQTVKKALTKELCTHKTFYTSNVITGFDAGASGDLNRAFITDLGNIPKYRNDTLATVQVANLHQARLKDNLTLKSFKFIMTLDASTARSQLVRIIIFRGTSPAEIFNDSGSNLFTEYTTAASSGASRAMKNTSPQGQTLPFNMNLVRHKRDYIHDKTYFVAGNTNLDGLNMKTIVINKRINYKIEYEEKGDTTSATELKGGLFWIFLIPILSETGRVSTPANVMWRLEQSYCE